MRRFFVTIFLFGLAGCQTGGQVPVVPVAAQADPSQDQKMAQALFKPLPEREVASNEMVELGRMLYYDPRLSVSGKISCNSCHSLTNYGVDGQPTSSGDEGQLGGRNSPTVYNASLHMAQFWDGRSPNVEDQAMGPVLNSVEMAMPDVEHVATVLNGIPDYKARFVKLFPDQKSPATLVNAAHAIGTFERGLRTPSGFDDYLNGNSEALTQEEKTGLKTFVTVGCASCHSGVAIGGNSYQKMGLKVPYPDSDVGRFDVTGKERDRGVFKVPSLRNITETGPYLSRGQVADLAETVQLMGHHQLGKELTPSEVEEIRTFLGSLKGQIPEDYIAVPTLPKDEAGFSPQVPIKT